MAYPATNSKFFPFYQGSVAAAQKIKPGQIADGVHTGLWFTRFYSNFADNQNWTVDEDGKSSWIIDTARLGLSGNSQKIHDLLTRQSTLCKALNGEIRILQTQGLLVTGTGLSHPVENGFTFHPTLGVPYLPASSIKGLLRGWVEQWMSFDDETERHQTIARWFGAAKGDGDTNGVSEGVGSFIFFDALPSHPVQLVCDVVTPHQGEWYSDAKIAPADWHNPIPIPFLAVAAKTTFHFMVAPREGGGTALTELPRVVEALVQALECLGAGAKTATGYGRMVALPAPIEVVANTECWAEASFQWEKGSRCFSVTNHKNQRTKALQEEGSKHLNSLSESSRKKLEKGKPVKGVAWVKIQGNQIVLQKVGDVESTHLNTSV